MHRSRVFAVIIDVPAAADAAATAFWSGALGVTARPDPGEPQFKPLPGALAGLHTALQTVEDVGRYHLDIETDDVPAETERLLALGATRVSTWLECQVLRAPGGHLLCVIPVEGDPDTFAAEARIWNSGR